MYISKRDSGKDEFYQVITTLPSGLEFLCRRVNLNDADEPEVNTAHCSLKRVILVPEEDGDGYFENASLYQNWSDLVRDL